MPPVDVPAIRSKYRATEQPPRWRFSNAARKAAGNTPRIPPPSMTRMRKARSFGQASGTRRRLRAPDERFSEIWLPPSDIATPIRLRVPSTACPVPGSEPDLVAGQPVDGPRHDGFRDRVNRKPLELQRVIEAEDGLLGTDPVRVVVRDRIARRFRSSTQQWGFHGDTRIAG